MSNKCTRLILLSLFFLSGASALIYQVVWVRMLGLVFGVTIYAVSAVLTAFMAGLSLGSLYFGRRVDRYKSPLKLFAFLEIAIGGFALLFPFLLSQLSNIYLLIHQHLSTSFYLLSLIRFTLAFLLLLIPTTLMGGTLPVLSKFFVRRLKELGWNIGSLYAVNNWGAAVGCLGAGFFLIQAIGVKETLYLAAVVNILIGLMSLELNRHLVTGEMEREQDNIKIEESKEDTGQIYPKYITCLVLSVFAIEGFISLAYEVVWTRILAASVMANTTYSFVTVVTTFIFGLALGSFIVSRFIDTKRNLLALFASIEVAIGLSALLMLPIFGKLPHLLPQKLLIRLGGTWGVLTGIEFLMCFLVMLIPTTLMGMTLPLVSRICTTNLRRLGRWMGNISCLDTVGSIFGSFAAAFILIPWIGMQRSILVLAIMNIAIGGIIFLLHPTIRRRTKWAIILILLLSSQIANMVIPHQVYFCRKGKGPGAKLLYYKEGATATVVVRQPEPVDFKFLEINGADVAGTSPDLRSTQKIQAHLPLLLYEASTGKVPEQVLLVGLGSGGTAWSTSQHKVKKIDCVELVPGVIEAATIHFKEVNHNVFDDPRFRLIIEDGRNYVLTTKKKYDLILTESIHPAIEGNANLYSKEYFELCRRRLTEDGIVSVWVPLWRLSEADVKMILKTFATVFPHATLWYTANTYNKNLLLIGSQKRPKIDFSLLKQMTSIEEIHKDLEKVNMDNPFALVSSLMLDEDAITKYIEGAQIHTENHPYLEFSAPKKWRFGRETTIRNLSEISRMRSNILPFLINVGDTDREIAVNKERLSRYFHATHYRIEGILCRMEGTFEEAVGKFRKALAINPEDKNAEYLLKSVNSEIRYRYLVEGTNYRNAGRYGEAIMFYEKVLEIDPHSPEALVQLGIVYNEMGMYDQAITTIKQAIEVTPDFARAYSSLGVAYINKGMYDDAIITLQKAVEIDPNYPPPHYYLGLAYIKSGSLDEAVSELEKTIKLVPNSVEGRYHLAMIYISMGKYKEAEVELKKILRINPHFQAARLALKDLKKDIRNQ